MRTRGLLLACALLLVVAACSSSSAPGPERWIGTWKGQLIPKGLMTFDVDLEITGTAANTACGTITWNGSCPLHVGVRCVSADTTTIAFTFDMSMSTCCPTPSPVKWSLTMNADGTASGAGLGGAVEAGTCNGLGSVSLTHQ
jgi:hypothetical protein